MYVSLGHSFQMAGNCLLYPSNVKETRGPPDYVQRGENAEFIYIIYLYIIPDIKTYLCQKILYALLVVLFFLEQSALCSTHAQKISLRSILELP